VLEERAADLAAILAQREQTGPLVGTQQHLPEDGHTDGDAEGISPAEETSTSAMTAFPALEPPEPADNASSSGHAQAQEQGQVRVLWETSALLHGRRMACTYCVCTQQAGAIRSAAAHIQSAIRSFFVRSKSEERELIFLGMQAPVTAFSVLPRTHCCHTKSKSSGWEDAAKTGGSASSVLDCKVLHAKYCMQPSLGEREPVVIDSRAAAHKHAAQAAAQKQYEEAVVAQHAQLLKDEGNAIREALQEKASLPSFSNVPLQISPHVHCYRNGKSPSLRFAALLPLCCTRVVVESSVRLHARRQTYMEARAGKDGTQLHMQINKWVVENHSAETGRYPDFPSADSGGSNLIFNPLPPEPPASAKSGQKLPPGKAGTAAKPGNDAPKGDADTL
jgi:hypothetical protein